MNKKFRLLWSLKTTFILVSLILVTVFASTTTKTINYDDGSNEDYYDEQTNTIYLSKMPLKDKITQMIIVNHVGFLQDYYKENKFGGVYIVKAETKTEFQDIVSFYNCNDCVPMFISVDLEGRYSNPFSNIQEFSCLSEIKSNDAAYALGDEQGKLLSELGINIIYSPVLDLEDNIWHCRNFEHFKNNPEELANVAISYLQGLHKNNIIAIAKHYPGKTLKGDDLHKGLVYVDVSDDDLVPFEKIKNYADGIMVTHSVSTGKIESYNKPCSISKDVINQLDYDGLIVADDIGMTGLEQYYINNNIEVGQSYIDVINAGNNLIIYFDLDTKNMDNMIKIIMNAVENNEISIKTINDNIKKILEQKNIKVVE